MAKSDATLETEAAEFLGHSVRALQNWRSRGGGPEFIRVSARSIRYRRRDLIAPLRQVLVVAEDLQEQRHLILDRQRHLLRIRPHAEAERDGDEEENMLQTGLQAVSDGSFRTGGRSEST